MIARLTSAMLVSALIRRVQAAGGFGTVMKRGDADAGAIVIECADRGVRHLVLERSSDARGQDGWRIAERDAADNQDAVNARLTKRASNDPDLWIIELDIADAERFAAETIGSG